MNRDLAVQPRLLSRLARRSAIVAVAGLLVLVSGRAIAATAGDRPNVVLVMTDDQGYGDLGCHGNTVINTPMLDRLYHQSIRLTDFHVDPTCSPTRSALLTGRYSCRTGVWHTIMGRSILRRDEVTFGNLFSAAGYRTGVFGKWHLGDNYPYRATDRGFAESLVHGGGGITQTPDYWGNSYFNPVVYHNGKPVRTNGYCTDVFFGGAIKFIEENRQRPFFVYLPTNVAHSPLQVDPSYAKPYLAAGVPRRVADFYGMLANFDENMGRLLKKLDELKLADNTILIFMTDNGTAGGAYNAGMRGRKGSQYDGGHRVPCFIRWPVKLKSGKDIGRLTAHIDILPTLLDLCNIPTPDELELDGMSLRSLLVTEGEALPNRTLFVQSHRIEEPEPWRKSAIMTDRFRLIDGKELYDMRADPGQKTDIAADNPNVVNILRRDYEVWYKDVSRRFDEYTEIVLGSPKENPTTLTCHDWHGPKVPWNQGHIASRLEANGFWAVEVEQPGRYEFTLRERPAVANHPLPPGAARLKIDKVEKFQAIQAGSTGVRFLVDLPAGKAKMQTWLAEKGGAVRGAYFVDVKYLGK